MTRSPAVFFWASPFEPISSCFRGREEYFWPVLPPEILRRLLRVFENPWFKVKPRLQASYFCCYCQDLSNWCLFLSPSVYLRWRLLLQSSFLVYLDIIQRVCDHICKALAQVQRRKLTGLKSWTALKGGVGGAHFQLTWRHTKDQLDSSPCAPLCPQSLTDVCWMNEWISRADRPGIKPQLEPLLAEPQFPTPQTKDNRLAG